MYSHKFVVACFRYLFNLFDILHNKRTQIVHVDSGVFLAQLQSFFLQYIKRKRKKRRNKVLNKKGRSHREMETTGKNAHLIGLKKIANFIKINLKVAGAHQELRVFAVGASNLCKDMVKGVGNDSACVRVARARSLHRMGLASAWGGGEGDLEHSHR